jgi:hypothetical protein
VSVWKLTVRHGPEVVRTTFEDLDDAIGELRRQATSVRSQGNLAPVASLRDFEPGQRINARLEISGKGLLRPPTAGVDVHGDGTMLAFEGGIRRVPIETADGESVFDAVRARLRRGS